MQSELFCGFFAEKASRRLNCKAILDCCLKVQFASKTSSTSFGLSSVATPERTRHTGIDKKLLLRQGYEAQVKGLSPSIVKLDFDAGGRDSVEPKRGARTYAR